MIYSFPPKLRLVRSSQMANADNAHDPAASLRPPLLSERIKELHLRPDAPYPSEVAEGHRLVREWREK